MFNALFYGALCMSDGRMTDELERIWKEAAVPRSKNYLGTSLETEENHEKPVS
jgi:hypothetical protein